MKFLDTNIIIRFLTKDHPDQTERSEKYLEKIKNGEIEVVTTSVHAIEAVYVLMYQYHMDKKTVADALQYIYSFKGIKMTDRTILLRALAIFRSSTKKIDLSDCFAIAYSEEKKIDEIVSFDHDFDSYRDIVKRIEP